jgi:hypothetical protein
MSRLRVQCRNTRDGKQGCASARYDTDKDDVVCRPLKSRVTDRARWSDDVFGAGALAGRWKGGQAGVVVVGSWGLLLKPGVLVLGPGQSAGIRREEGKGDDV